MPFGWGAGRVGWLRFCYVRTRVPGYPPHPSPLPQQLAGCVWLEWSTEQRQAAGGEGTFIGGRCRDERTRVCPAMAVFCFCPPLPCHDGFLLLSPLLPRIGGFQLLSPPTPHWWPPTPVPSPSQLGRRGRCDGFDVFARIVGERGQGAEAGTRVPPSPWPSPPTACRLRMVGVEYRTAASCRGRGDFYWGTLPR